MLPEKILIKEWDGASVCVVSSKKVLPEAAKLRKVVFILHWTSRASSLKRAIRRMLISS